MAVSPSQTVPDTTGNGKTNNRDGTGVVVGQVGFAHEGIWKDGNGQS
jgi:hypothetical protein